MTRSPHIPRHTRPSGGFTLVEMLITVTIMAILAAMAIPAFSRLVANHRMVTSTNGFREALMEAKSEARTRNTGNPRSGVSLRSMSGDENFAAGWQIFTDADLDGVLDAGTDNLLQQYAQAGGTATIRRVLRAGSAGAFTYTDATAPADRMVVSFRRDGSNTSPTPAFFRICDPAMPSLRGRILQVSVVGIVTLDSTNEVCP